MLNFHVGLLIFPIYNLDDCCEYIKLERTGFPFPVFYKKQEKPVNGRVAYVDMLGEFDNLKNILFYDGDPMETDHFWTFKMIFYVVKLNF